MDKVKTCFSVAEMAEMLGISRSNAFELTHREDFYPAFRIGRRILINAAKLDRWLEEQTNDRG